MSASDNPYVDLLGIAPEDCPPNYYQLLGLPLFESNPEAVQAALASRMRLLKGVRTAEKNEACRRLVAELTAARVCLLNPNRKSAYDKGLRHALGDHVESADEDEEKELPALALLKVMRRQRMLSAEIVNEWTRRVEQSPTPLSAVQLSKQLVDAGVVTFGIAKRLLAKAREFAETMAVEGKSIDEAPVPTESTATSIERPAATVAAPSESQTEKPREDEPSKRVDDEEELGLAPLDDEGKKTGYRPRRTTTSSSETTEKQAESTSAAEKSQSKSSPDEVSKKSKSATADRLAEELAADAGFGPLDELSADDMLDGADADDDGFLYRRRRRGLAGWFADIVPRQGRPRTKEERLERRNQSRLLAMLVIGALTIIILVVILAINVSSKKPLDYYYEGKAAFAEGKDEEAIKALSVFVTEDPENEMKEDAQVRINVAMLRQKINAAESFDGVADQINLTLLEIEKSPYFSAVKKPLSDLILETLEEMSQQFQGNPKLMEDARLLINHFDKVFLEISKSDRANAIRKIVIKDTNPASPSGATTPGSSSTVPPTTRRPSSTVPPTATLPVSPTTSGEETAGTENEQAAENGTDVNSGASGNDSAAKDNDDNDMMPEILD